MNRYVFMLCLAVSLGAGCTLMQPIGSNQDRCNFCGLESPGDICFECGQFPRVLEPVGLDERIEAEQNALAKLSILADGSSQDVFVIASSHQRPSWIDEDVRRLEKATGKKWAVGRSSFHRDPGSARQQADESVDGYHLQWYEEEYLHRSVLTDTVRKLYRTYVLSEL